MYFYVILSKILDHFYSPFTCELAMMLIFSFPKMAECDLNARINKFERYIFFFYFINSFIITLKFIIDNSF